MTRALVGLTLTLALATASVLVYVTEDRAETGSVDGKTLFQAKGCVGCHQRGALGELQIGPNLTALSERATQDYVRQSITDPQAYRVSGYPSPNMPTFDLTDAELDALVDFLLERDS